MLDSTKLIIAAQSIFTTILIYFFKEYVTEILFASAFLFNFGFFSYIYIEEEINDMINEIINTDNIRFNLF